MAHADPVGAHGACSIARWSMRRSKAFAASSIPHVARSMAESCARAELDRVGEALDEFRTAMDHGSLDGTATIRSHPTRARPLSDSECVALA
ncbi:hypothetical protein [Methylorubrum sp. POS3]|uniref:hypothetical protein n=1 Tax=Methylorubrum sp. POS3 TaxID=2998492 RepID=UPI0037281F48